MSIWVKPSGIEIEINDLKETVSMAKSLGWKRKDEKKRKETKKGTDS